MTPPLPTWPSPEPWPVTRAISMGAGRGHTTAQLPGWVSPASRLPLGLIPCLHTQARHRPQLPRLPAPDPHRPIQRPPTQPGRVLGPFDAGPVATTQGSRGRQARAEGWHLELPGATPSGAHSGHRADRGEERQQESRGQDSGSETEPEGPPGQKSRASSWNRVGGRRPLGGSREPVPREEPPSPSWVHTALSLKPEPRSPCVPGPESAPRVATPSRPPRPCPASYADTLRMRPALGRDITVSSRVRPLPSGGCLPVSSSSVYLILPLFPISIKLLLLLPIILGIGGLASVTTEVCPSLDVLQIYLPLGLFPRPLVTMHFSQTFGCLLYIHICRSVPFAPTPEPRPAQEGPHFTPHKFSLLVW